MDENNLQSCTLSTFLAEFKAMFNQLMQQNNIVLNMLMLIKSSYSQISNSGIMEC